MGVLTVCGVGGSICGCRGGERRRRCEIVDKGDNGVTKEVAGIEGMVMLALDIEDRCRYPVVLYITFDT